MVATVAIGTVWFLLFACVTYRMSGSTTKMLFAQSRHESRVKQTLMYLSAFASAAAFGYVFHEMHKDNLGGAIFLAVLAGLLVEAIGGFLTAAWGEVFGMEQDQGDRLETARTKHEIIKKRGWPGDNGNRAGLT